MVGASWVYPQPTARSSGYEGELSVKPVSEWCDGSGAAPRPLKGGALGAGGESDTNEKPRHSAQPKRLRGGLWRGLSPLWRALARALSGAAKGVAVRDARLRSRGRAACYAPDRVVSA